MNEEYKIFEGETAEKAIEKGLKSLKLDRDQADVKIIEEGSSSFIGFFSKPYKIGIRPKENSAAPCDANTDSSASEVQDENHDGANNPVPNDDNLSSVPPVDGDYRLSLIDDCIYIVTTAPEGVGKPVKSEKIIDDLRRAGLKQYDTEAIKQAATLAFSGTPVKICNPASVPRNFKLVRDCNIKLIIDKSKLSASVIIEAPFNGGEEVSVAKVQLALSNAGIKIAPDYEVIARLTKSKEYDTPHIVAQGKLPVAGEDGYIKWYFETQSKKIEISIDASGNVDYHKILKINTVNANDIIGEKVDPVPGVDGYNIFNEPIKAKVPRPAKMVKGKNVDITEDGIFFQSLISGQLIIKNEIPSVMPLYEVRGDVDFSTGNIEFNGTVIIHGTVLDGFSVKAEGNIEIKKTVNAATLEAKGNIILEGGFIGKDKGIIKAGGKIGARFIQSGTVYSDDEIIVENAILHSNVTSGRQIVVKGKKASIIGGKIFASDYIESQIIGALAGTKTLIETGVDILKEQDIARIDNEITQTNEYIKKIIISIDTLNKLKFKNPEKFSTAQEQILQKSTATKEMLASKLLELEEQKNTLCNEIINSQKGKVVALGAFYPGVSIMIRKHFKYDVKDTIKCSAIGISDGDIRILPI